MKLVQIKDGKILSLPSSELKKSSLQALTGKHALHILEVLRQGAQYPANIARTLKISEQNLNYYLRKLESEGFIYVAFTDQHQGALAKHYALSSQAWTLLLDELKPSSSLITAPCPALLSPFIKDGALNAKIVLGSPKPHGASSASAKDGSVSLELMLFLGTFLTQIPNGAVVFDTQLSSMEENLILLGGPIVNAITNKVHNKLPIRFDRDKFTYSMLTKRSYKSESAGTVQLIRNPFSKQHTILVIAGLHYAGTRSALFGVVNRLDRLSKGNSVKKSVLAHVIRGADRDADGKLDWIDVLE